MRHEYWEVRKEDAVTPEMLKADPDKYGGMGIIMACAIQCGAISVPLRHNGMYIDLRTTDPKVAERIVKDGGIDVVSEGYWNYLASDKAKVYFKGTEELVPLYKSL